MSEQTGPIMSIWRRYRRNEAEQAMVSIRAGHVSITGNYRENNEDSYFIDPEQRYFVVADGMGGQNAGEKASGMAIEHIPQQLNQLLSFDSTPKKDVVAAIDKAVATANSEIMALSEGDPSYRNMGTTVVLLVRSGDNFYIGGVGDSRAYLLRDGKLDQLTTDHSLTEALLQAGTITAEEAKTHRYKNVLYRYLGSKDGAAGTDAVEIRPQKGDRFLICSDGVTDGLKTAAELQPVMTSSDDPQVVAESLIDGAVKGGSKDNITAVVLFVE